MRLFSGQYFLLKLGIAIIIAGLVCGFHAARNIIDDSKTPLDYQAVTAADIKEGALIEGDVRGNYGIYEEIYTTDRFGRHVGGSDYAFLIPVGEEEFIGLYTGNDELIYLLDAQTDATYAYLSDEKNPAPDPVHFKGRVEKMNSEEEGFYIQCLEEMGFTASEISRYALKYHIRIINFGQMPVTLIFSIGFLLVGVCVMAVFVWRRSRGYC